MALAILFVFSVLVGLCGALRGCIVMGSDPGNDRAGHQALVLLALGCLGVFMALGLAVVL